MIWPNIDHIYGIKQMIACTTYLCLSVLYGHIIIYHIPNTYNYIYVVVSSQSDLYDARDYCISGTYWMQMTTVLLWHMTFLLMTTAILLRAEFSNVLQRYSLTYSITYMFIVLYMESMLFSRLLLLYLHISTLIVLLISVNNADMAWRLHWRQQKK